jgi:hypothetical protein
MANPRAHWSESEERAGDHPPTRVLAKSTAHRDQTATELEPRIVANVAVNENRPFAHPEPAARERSAEEVASIAVNPDRAATHLGSRPVSGRTLDLDRPAQHPHAQSRTDVSTDLELSRYHPRPKASEVAQISLEDQDAIPGVSAELEELTQLDLAISGGNEDSGHLGGGAGNPIGTKPFAAKRQVDRSVAGQGQWHRDPIFRRGNPSMFERSVP